MQIVRSANLEPIVSRTDVDDAFHDALRLFVGRGRRYSVKQLSNGTGVPDRMIECAISPLDSTDFRPLARDHMWSIIRFLGAPFTNEVLPRLAHLGTFDLPKEECPAPGEFVAEHAEDHAGIARAAADGIFCPKDRGRLRTIGENLIESGMALVGLGHRRHQREAA